MKTTIAAVDATGAALVLEDGEIAWPEGRPGAYDVRLPLRWKRRQIGELVCDRDTPFSEEERALLEAIAHHAAVALEHGRAVMRGVLAQEIHHRVKNNLQTVASLLRIQARRTHTDVAREALTQAMRRVASIAVVHDTLSEGLSQNVDFDTVFDRVLMLITEVASSHATTVRPTRTGSFGALPSEYFQYYYFEDEVLGELRSKGTTRAEDILGWVPGYWEHYVEQARSDRPVLDPGRSRGGINASTMPARTSRMKAGTT